MENEKKDAERFIFTVSLPIGFDSTETQVLEKAVIHASFKNLVIKARNNNFVKGKVGKRGRNGEDERRCERVFSYNK